ncbi:unnamed protein product [Mytilus coruscus]|uniref:Uncharacterized protein n=1 Tax=Mytilus coruscus TaxID=42192 RepID=A0A6J8AMB3_MYTCO|nr:unnamed protein product [Mytilus coruscus]
MGTTTNGQQASFFVNGLGDIIACFLRERHGEQQPLDNRHPSLKSRLKATLYKEEIKEAREAVRAKKDAITYDDVDIFGDDLKLDTAETDFGNYGKLFSKLDFKIFGLKYTRWELEQRSKTCCHDIAKCATSSVKQYQSICKQWELEKRSKTCCHDIAKCAKSSVKQYQSIWKQWELEQRSKTCCHDIAKCGKSSAKQYQSICEQWELKQMNKTCSHDIAKSVTSSVKQYQSICKQWELKQMNKTCSHDIAKSVTSSVKQYQSICKQWELKQMNKTCKYSQECYK